MILFSTQVKAQGKELDPDAMMESTKNDFLIVVSAGLGGAILGLSTLSFVEEPKDHTDNIMTGAAIGIIVGVAVVAYMQAEKSSAMFYDEQANNSLEFDTKNRKLWHAESFAQNLSMDHNNINVMNWSTRF
jgi:hypothetical protein